MAQKLFESDRLVFTSLSRNDFDGFCEMELDPEVMKYYTTRTHGTMEFAEASMKRYLDYQAKYPYLGGFTAREKETGAYIGLGALIHLELNPDHEKYEVGYRLPLRNWNKGYATEICRALLAHGFGKLGMTEIYGTTHPDNLVSQKILMKCGMKALGDWPVYGGSKAYVISA